jgi:glycine dehydrogenase subunit 2
VRHYTRLSRQNYAIDLGLFPLGSCTMKHNRASTRRSRGCPASPTSTPAAAGDGPRRAPGDQRARLLAARPHRNVRRAMSPKAGHMASCAACYASAPALEARGDMRKVVLVPESAHGTNPATAAFAGYPGREHSRERRGPRGSRRPEGEARARRRGGDDHQPETPAGCSSRT